MRALQWLIHILFVLSSYPAEGAWVTKPYLGFGQMNLSLGQGLLINGSSTGSVLGAKTGWMMSPNFYLALDYSRSGPFLLPFKDSIYGTSITSGLFALTSGGLGLEYQGQRWSFWYGRYLLQTLQEHRVDFQMKGAMQRLGLGFALDPKFTLNLYSDFSEFSLASSNAVTDSLLCYGTSATSCSKKGKSSAVFIAFVAVIK
jgi:hypothetical protein